MTSDSTPNIPSCLDVAKAPVPAGGDGESQEPEMAYFKVVPASGGYRAQFWSGGNLVWWTEVYTRREGAQNAIDTIRRHGGSAQQLAA
jgi:uncharacterized protein YegP (UPF0339 family)